MTKIILAYCNENAELAATLEQKLARAGAPIAFITNAPNAPAGQFSAEVMATTEPVLLLITDNYLKNANCMTSALGMIQTLLRQQRATIIVADGKQADGAPAPTHFERLADVIRYLNHWQSAFLDITNREQHANSPAEHTALESQVAVIHDISVEVGEFIGALRDAGFMRWEDLERDDFAPVLKKLDLTHWEENYHYEEHTEPEQPGETSPPPPYLPPSTLLEAPQVTGPLAPVFDIGDSYTAPATPPPAPPVVLPEPTAALEAEPELPAQKEEEEVFAPIQPETAPLPTPELAAEIKQTIDDAWFWLERGHTERGMQVFQTAVEQYPHDDLLRSEYLKALSRYAPDSESASEQLGILHDQGLPEARSYDLMGEIAFGKGDYDFAKYCWERTASLDHHYAGIWEKLGRLSDENLGEPEAAAHYFNLVLESDPTRLDLRERLAQLLMDTLHRPADTIPHLRQILAEQPHHPSAWFDLARACKATGDDQQAEVYYRKATGIKPSLKTEENDQTFIPQVESGLNTPQEVAEEIPAEEDAMPVDQPEEMPEAVSGDESEELEEEPLEAPADEAIEAPAQVVSIFEGGEEEEEEEDHQEPEPPLDLHPEETADEEAHFLETPPTSQEALSGEGANLNPSTLHPPPLTLTVLITGATSGIGRATAELFAREGHRLILTGRRTERLEELKNHFEQEYQREVLTLHFDVRNPVATETALNHLPENWHNIDVLVNNAGLAKGLAPIHEGSLLHWETMIDTNLKGLLYVTRLVAPGMVARRRGHIINVGSVAGKEVYANGNVYCATKFAVDALTRAIRLDLVKHNIRVSQVSPGHVEETEFALTRFDGDAERAKIYEDFQPLKASDVAEVIYFMATRPAHVNILDIEIMATQQASATVIDRSGRSEGMMNDE